MYHFFSALGEAMFWPFAVAGADEAVAAASGLASASDSRSSPASSSTGGAACSSVSVSFGSGDDALSINQLREVRPDKVEQAENDRRDDRHDDHHERGGADFLGRGPGDLLELGSDLVSEEVVLV